MEKAVIAGASGVIGLALISELVEHDIEVLVLCRSGSKREHLIPAHPLVEKKYCSMDGFETLQNKTGKEYDVFYHLAWEGTSRQDRDDMYLQNGNVKHSLDAVGLARRFGCKRFIGAGSQAEYGRFDGMLTADTPVCPENGYGIGKLAAGLMTREYAHQLGMEHIWVRALSVYGPNSGSHIMLMRLIAELKAGKVPALTKGEQMWDFLYSGDVARALWLLGDRGVDGKTYVLGTGTSRPLREYIEELRDIVSPGAELGFGMVPYSDREVMTLCADISELQKDTGWKPEVTFTQGIRSLMQ